MRKITTLLTIMLFVGATAFAQIQRQTLLEVFTSSTCGPCVAGNLNFKNVLPTIENYTVVKYQMSWPGSGDPYYNAQGGLARRNFYGVNSVPNMQIDGQWDQNAQSFTKPIFNTYNSNAAHVEFEMNEATYDPSSKVVAVDFDVIADKNYAAGDFRLVVAIVENLTTGNVGSNGETEFEFVFMANLPNKDGTVLTNGLTKDTPENFSFSRNLSTSFIEEFSDLKVVVWVEESSSKKIENSAWADLRDIAVVGIEEESTINDLSIYPNPTQGLSTIRFDLEQATNVTVNVVDITGKTVQTVANTRYNAGTNKIEINGENLAEGLYYVSIITEQDVITRKLMLNR